jgi:hypothetical protein
MSFANLKRNRADIASLTKAAESVGGSPKQSYVDDRYWKPTVDKAGNGYAVIRFLPAAEGEELPWVRYWDHGFKGPTGQWYIENSLTTIGKEDPVSEMNSVLWNSGRDEDKEIARKQKRRLNYIANIYVVKDAANPSREGQVYLYKFGKKIFDKLNDAMNPQFQDEDPINPFDFWEGADFKLKIRQVEGYRNYDKSEFDSVSVLSGADGAELSDEVLEDTWSKQHSLSDIVDPKNFKSYDELKAKLYKVLGLDGSTHAPKVTAEDDNTGMGFTPSFKERSAPEPVAAPSPTLASDTGDDESLDFFKSLAEDNS